MPTLKIALKNYLAALFFFSLRLKTSNDPMCLGSIKNKKPASYDAGPKHMMHLLHHVRYSFFYLDVKSAKFSV